MSYPKQSPFYGRRVLTIHPYDAGKDSWGTIVRDDADGLYVGIIKLDDGRYITTDECLYSPNGPDPNFVPWKETT